MQIKSESGRVFHLPSDNEEAAIRAGIAADPDARELSGKELNNLRSAGRPKADVTKDRITIRLSCEVTEYFRATGKGWQTRMDEVLREYVELHR